MHSAQSPSKCALTEGAYMLLHPLLDKGLPLLETAQNRHQELKLWTPKPSSYLIDAYVKSGTHYLWDIMMMLLNREAVVSPTYKEYGFLELNSVERLEALPSPTVYSTHIAPDYLPENLCKMKTAFILRNPKDVAVSTFHHNRMRGEGFKSWDDHFNWWMTIAKGQAGIHSAESWWNFTRLVWERRLQPNSILLSYEDMLQDFKVEIGRLATFMDVEVDDELLADMESATDIETVKRQKTQVSTDPDIRYFLCLYRRGKVGGWREYFSEEQSDQFDRVTDDLLDSCPGLKFKYG